MKISQNPVDLYIEKTKMDVITDMEVYEMKQFEVTYTIKGCFGVYKTVVFATDCDDAVDVLKGIVYRTIKVVLIISL